MDCLDTTQLEILPKKVRRIHFLIHPGCNFHTLTPRTEPHYQKLLEAYLDGARKMEEDEIMVLYVNSKLPDFQKDIDKGLPYVQIIHQLKNILGKRLFIFTRSDGLPSTHIPRSSSGKPFEKPLDTALIIQEIFARGYSFTNDVDTISYGENFDVCLPHWTNTINLGLGFSQKTFVDLVRTNFFILSDPGKYLEQIIGDLREEFERLDFIMPPATETRIYS